MILSSWLSVEAWNRWAASEQRRKIEDAIGDLLVEPERVTVYEVA
jgi:heme-degrading monooxygenase HmoA